MTDGSSSQYENRMMLDSHLGSGVPATLYLGASTTTIANDGTGITEPTGGSYARVAISNNSSNFPASTIVLGLAQKQNGAEFTFPQATANWGTITDVFLSDDVSAGNMRWYAPLTTSQTINTGGALIFPIGSLTFKLG